MSKCHLWGHLVALVWCHGECRKKHAKEGRGNKNERNYKRERSGREVKTLSMFGNKEETELLTMFFIKDEQRVHMQERLMEEMEKEASA